MRSSHTLIVLGLLAALLSPRMAYPCTGNCNGDARVTIDEIIVGVNMALGLLPLATCPRFDRDGSGAVGIDELIAAIDSLERGCPITPAPETASSDRHCARYTDGESHPPSANPDRDCGYHGRLDADGARVQIQGQFQVLSGVFGDGPGERQTVLGDCNGDGLLDAVRLQWTHQATHQGCTSSRPRASSWPLRWMSTCPPIPGPLPTWTVTASRTSSCPEGSSSSCVGMATARSTPHAWSARRAITQSSRPW